MIEHISRFFIALLCLFFPVLGLSGCGSTAMTATTRTGFYFDTIINITVYDTDISHANETLDSCFDLAAEYENMLSRTVEGSDIWEINHAQGQPVESGLAQRLECFPVAGGFRVGFQGDLRVLGHVIPLADGFEQGGQALDTQKAGGAAAEIDGVDLMRGGGGRGFRQVGTQGVHIIIHPGILAGQGVKVAIGTLLPAEGNMKIQPQGARRNMHRCDPPIH